METNKKVSGARGSTAPLQNAYSEESGSYAEAPITVRISHWFAFHSTAFTISNRVRAMFEQGSGKVRTGFGQGSGGVRTGFEQDSNVVRMQLDIGQT